MKSILRLCNWICFLLLLTACRYEDGPVFSLRSAKNRISREWEIEKFIVNGNDSTSNFKDNFGYCESYRFVEHEDGSSSLLAYSCFGVLPEGALFGNWNIVSAGDCIFINLDGVNTSGEVSYPLQEDAIWDIRRLTMDELWINRKFKGKEYEIHFKAL